MDEQKGICRGNGILTLALAGTLAAALSACAPPSAGDTGLSAGGARPSTVHPDLWPQVPPPLATDAALERRIDALLESMSVERKVGQLIQADLSTVTPEDLRRFPLGSVLNGGNSGPGGDDLAPAEQWLALADAFYAASIDPAHGPNPIPALWGTDAVHGHSNIIGATIFPHNIALGAARDAELIRRIGEVTAREISVTGQEWTFAPTLAVVRDDRWGRTYESYSEDPEIVAEYAAAMVEGLQGAAGTEAFLGPGRVLATAKHFVGDGGTAGGTDQGDNQSTEAELRDIHAAGYPPAIAAGVQTVMASFSAWQGVKLHGHRGLITDVLKHRMGFDGLVVGDWNGHGQVEGCTTESCAASINAGIDMLMAPDSWRGLYESTLAQVKAGEISMERVDDAVRRILRVKLRYGLFEKGPPSSRPLAGQFELLGAPEHRAVAREAVRKSLVLLKNQDQVLPLAPRQRVLVAGDGADNIPKQCGGWTLSWQGTGVSNEHFPGAQSLYDGIREVVRAAGGTAELSPAGAFSRKPDVAIVVFGEDPYAEFQGDRENVAYAGGDDRDLALIRRLREQGVPVIAVFLSGRPLWVNREINASNAFVAAWLPGSEGGGVADVLFRKPDGTVHHDFHGKLSFSWPRSPQQTAVNRNATGEAPLFAYGYGLRYADAGDVPALSEETGALTQSVETREFFSGGRPGSGWHWAISAGGEHRVVGEAAGSVKEGALEVSPTDHRAQEDALLLRWDGSGTAQAVLTGEAAIDLQREANGQVSLAFDYSVVEPAQGEVMLAIECGSDCRGVVDVTGELASAQAGQWRHLKVPLSCFENAGANMSRVTAPFAVSTGGSLALALSGIHLESGTDDIMRCAD